MAISTLDIRSQTFTRRLRGVDGDEVRAYLSVLAESVDDLQRELRYRDTRIGDLEAKLVHYERIEEALQEALRTARESQRTTLNVATQQADHIRAEAHLQARALVQDAEGDRNRLRQEAQAIAARRKEISARLRAFLMSELEMLAHFEGEDPIGFIQLRRDTDASLASPSTPVLPASTDLPDSGPEARQDAPRAETPAPPVPRDTEAEPPSHGAPDDVDAVPAFDISAVEAPAVDAEPAAPEVTPVEATSEAGAKAPWHELVASAAPAAPESDQPDRADPAPDEPSPAEAGQGGDSAERPWPMSPPPAFAPEPTEAPVPPIPGSPPPTPDPLFAPASETTPRSRYVVTSLLGDAPSAPVRPSVATVTPPALSLPEAGPADLPPDEVEELARVRRLLDGLGA